jgi:Tol biopolymer transport system component
MKRILIALFASLVVVSTVLAQTPPPATEKKAETKESDKAEKKEEKKWDVNNPPGPQYDVPIDVSEGTWLSLDVSPDGSEIAFDLLGDIYTIPMTGGEARSLTSGIAWDMQPRYSPNGKWIAFTSDRAGGDNIWIMNRDGSKPQQVTKETFRLLNEPYWSPDSEYLVARKHFTAERSLGAGEIWLYHRSGGEGLQLTKKRTEQKDTGEPALSPDGRYLYYSDDTTPGAIYSTTKTRTRRYTSSSDSTGRRARSSHLSPVQADQSGRRRRRTASRSPSSGASATNRRSSSSTSSRAKRRRLPTSSIAICRRRGRSTASTRRWPGHPTTSRSSSGPVATSAASMSRPRR